MATGDLTTLADVKAWLQTGPAPFPVSDDALLSRLITAASRFIEGWIGRPVALGDWRELRDGTGGQRLTFTVFPVAAVLSLTIDGLNIPPAPGDGGYAAGYVFGATELALRGYVFTRRPQNVAVTYTAGFAVTPPAIAQACIELVCRKYRERMRIGETGRALTGTEAVTFAAEGFGNDLKALLTPYRVVAPVVPVVPAAAPTNTDAALLSAAL